MERRFTVYKITNTVNGKAYVGITKGTLANRWAGHRAKAFGENANTFLARAMRKYGCDAFQREELAHAFSETDLIALEILLIAQERTYYKHGGYNLTTGGEGRRGGRMTPEEIALRAEKTRGKKRTPEQRAHLSKVFTGIKKSAEHCQALSVSHMGKKRTQESIDKSAAFHRGRKRQPETAQLISSALKGNQNCLGRIAEFCKRGHPRVEGNLYRFKNKATGRVHAACATCVKERARLPSFRELYEHKCGLTRKNGVLSYDPIF